ncbi:hypothetical protein AAY473_030407 [Plecturocebus cupreus]
MAKPYQRPSASRGETPGTDTSLTAPRRSQTCRLFDFRLLASRLSNLQVVFTSSFVYRNPGAVSGILHMALGEAGVQWCDHDSLQPGPSQAQVIVLPQPPEDGILLCFSGWSQTPGLMPSAQLSHLKFKDYSFREESPTSRETYQPQGKRGQLAILPTPEKLIGVEGLPHPKFQP